MSHLILEKYILPVLLKTINFIYNLLFFCNHTCYCVGMVSVTSASRYVTQASRYQSRYRLDVHPRSDSTELAEAVPIVIFIYRWFSVYNFQIVQTLVHF